MRKVVILVILSFTLILAGCSNSEVKTYEKEYDNFVNNYVEYTDDLISENGTINENNALAIRTLNEMSDEVDDLLQDAVQYMLTFDNNTDTYREMHDIALNINNLKEEITELAHLLAFCDENINFCLPDRIIMEISPDYDGVRDVTEQASDNHKITEMYEILKDNEVVSTVYLIESFGYTEQDGLHLFIAISKDDKIDYVEIKRHDFTVGFDHIPDDVFDVLYQEELLITVAGIELLNPAVEIDAITMATINSNSINEAIEQVLNYHYSSK